jgi:hypothetical protein
MNIQRAQKRILFFVLVPAAVFYLGLRVYAQYRPVDVYVIRPASIPAELAAGLHIEEHKIDRIVTIESPYTSATDKILTTVEIQRLRSAIAWSGSIPPFIDSLTIQSPTSVLARRANSRFMLEYQLVRRGNRWLIMSATRGEVAHRTAQRD